MTLGTAPKIERGEALYLVRDDVTLCYVMCDDAHLKTLKQLPLSFPSQDSTQTMFSTIHVS